MTDITMKLNVDNLIMMALQEDISSEDVSTNAVMPNYQKGTVDLICKQSGIIAGLDVYARVFTLLDDKTEIEFNCKDGDEVENGQLIGTVKGDLHDIGKNLVKIMLEGKGIKVIDLGTDVAPDAFIDAAIEHNAKIICCSALLTTTMGEMKAIVDTAVARGVRDKFKIMIGGAPVTKEFFKLNTAPCIT